jgi:hypothetical protein
MANQIILKGCFELGCEDKHYAKGLCNKHYIQKRRHGRTGSAVHSLEGEIWKDMKDTEGRYQVSNLGRVKSTVYQNYKPLSPSVRKGGFFGFNTCIDNVRVSRMLHMEIARAFHENPFDDERVIILDDDRSNCRADNLQWISPYLRSKTMKALGEEGTPEAKQVLSFMQGDKEAIAGILERQSRRMGYLAPYFAWLLANRSNIDVESVGQDTLVKACHAMQRGLLRHTKQLDGWFSKIARNTLLNSSKKTFGEISQWGFNGGGEEFDRFDLMAGTN